MAQQCGGPSDPHCSLKQYVPVPVKGEFLVRNGKVLTVIETDSRDHTDEYNEWAVYTELEDDDVV